MNKVIDPKTLFAALFITGLSISLMASNASANEYSMMERECGLATTSTFFKTGSNELTQEAENSLEVMADCLQEEFEDRKVWVIGSADDRGDNTFNYTLALERAYRVEQYLTKLGVSPARIEVASLGEAGDWDNSVWYDDRRVDVLLGTTL